MDANGKIDDGMVTVWMVWNDGRKVDRISHRPEFYIGQNRNGRYVWRAVTRYMPNGKEILAIADLIGEAEGSKPYSGPGWSYDFEIPEEWLAGFGELWR